MSYAQKVFKEKYFIDTIFNSDRGLTFLGNLVGRKIAKVFDVGELEFLNLKPDSQPESETEVFRVDVQVQANTPKGGIEGIVVPVAVKHHPKRFHGGSESLDWNEVHALEGFANYFKEHADDPIVTWAVPVLLHHSPQYSTIVRGFVQGPTLEERLGFLDDAAQKLRQELSDAKRGKADEINRQLQILQTNRERYSVVPIRFLMRLVHIMNNNPQYFAKLHSDLEKEYDKPLEERYAQKLADYVRAIVPPEQATSSNEFEARLKRMTANFIGSLPYNALKLSTKRIVTRDYHAANIVLAGEKLADPSLLELPVSEEEILRRLCFFDWGKVGIGIAEAELADYMNSPALKYGETEITSGHSEAMTTASLMSGEVPDYSALQRSARMYRLIEPLRILRVAAKDPKRRKMMLDKFRPKYVIADNDVRTFLDALSEVIPGIKPQQD